LCRERTVRTRPNKKAAQRSIVPPISVQANHQKESKMQARQGAALFCAGSVLCVRDQTKKRRNGALRRRFFLFLSNTLEIGSRMLTPRTDKIVWQRSFVYVAAHFTHPFFLRRRARRVPVRNVRFYGRRRRFGFHFV